MHIPPMEIPSEWMMSCRTPAANIFWHLCQCCECDLTENIMIFPSVIFENVNREISAGGLGWGQEGGRLFIFSQEAMEYYMNEGAPWLRWWESIREVTIAEGISHIRMDAFYNCRNLESVVIADSVLEIGENAFWGCDGLTSIVIPSGVREIEANAFGACKNLSSVFFRGPAPEVDEFAFDSDTATLYFPANEPSWNYFFKKEPIIPIPPQQESPHPAIPQPTTSIPVVPSPSVDPPFSPFASYSPVEQEEIIQLEPNERTIVNAGPGTGKTWTLIEKIKYMLEYYETDPEHILVLCYTRAAADVVRSRLREAAERDELPMIWNLVEVRTFDSFATSLLYWVIEEQPDLLPSRYTLAGQDYDARISMATRVLKKGRDLLDVYEHVIVDEVQDLVGVRAELVLALLASLPDPCGFTLLGDSCQAIFDYLSEKDSSVLSSSDFYKNLAREFPDANHYTLDKNHRQGDKLGALPINYRKAILSGQEDAMRLEASKLCNTIRQAPVNLMRFTRINAAIYAKNGTLGILTRTNGQALQISSWLRNEDVPHILVRSENRSLAAWISRVIFNAETAVLDEDEFGDIFRELYPGRVADTSQYWQALVSTQRDSCRRHYEIEEILRGLYQRSSDPLLFQEPQNSDPPLITVSCVHRAKGREFDSVIVLDNVISPDDPWDGSGDNELEHKVCYVALTRPRKKLEQASIGDNVKYIHIMKDETRRCFKVGFRRGKKRFLSYFETGFSGDLNERSFARSPELQDTIRVMIQGDGRMKLIKCPEYTDKFVVYRLVPEQQEWVTLGYTTKYFAECMENAIQRIYNRHHRIKYSYFPDRLTDIYAEGLTTCISPDGCGLTGARQYGSMYIWNGIAVHGFGYAEKDRT